MAVELSNEPNSVPLVIVQGSTFMFSAAITDASRDFTGWTARAAIMNSFAARQTVKAFTVTVDSAGPGAINLTVKLTAAETALLSNTSAGDRRQSIGVYDLELVSADTVTVVRYMQGSVQLSREATI